MQLGYRKPITERDVWQLDQWDQTETLIKRYSSSAALLLPSAVLLLLYLC